MVQHWLFSIHKEIFSLLKMISKGFHMEPSYSFNIHMLIMSCTWNLLWPSFMIVSWTRSSEKWNDCKSDLVWAVKTDGSLLLFIRGMHPRACRAGERVWLFKNLSVFDQRNVSAKFPDPMLSVKLKYFIIKKRNAEFYRYAVPQKSNLWRLLKSLYQRLWK